MTQTVMSSRGQVVIPKEIREKQDWQSGKRFNVQETPLGVMLVEIPEKPLARLSGLLRSLPVSSRELIKERKREAQRKD